MKKITNKKINSQGENHYRKRIRKQKFSSVLLRQRRHYICGHLPPARANGAKREAIWYSSHTYRFSVGMRTIQKDKSSRKKTKDFCGKRSRNGEYRQQQKRLTKSKVCGDEVSYTFLKKVAKTFFTEVMNYVLFGMSHGKI